MMIYAAIGISILIVLIVVVIVTVCCKKNDSRQRTKVVSIEELSASVTTVEPKTPAIHP